MKDKKSKSGEGGTSSLEFKRRLYQWTLRLLNGIKVVPLGVANTVLVKQLIRSGTSVLANYVEAGAASSRKDYINFFSYALKSANESKVWLTLLRDTNPTVSPELSRLLDEVVELSNILAARIITMKRKP